MKKFLFYFIEFTWALPQNIVGLVAFLIFSRKNKVERFHNSIITYVSKENFGGISLGVFIFINPEKKEDALHDTKIHEYGHTIQALFLGPIWIFVIGLPSVIWCGLPALKKYRKEKNVSYYWLYCEGWANLWGLKWSKEEFLSEEFITTARFGKPLYETSEV